MAFNDGKHVMFSYSWKNQKLVSHLYDILTAENIPVWCDIYGGVKDNLYKNMAEAVENAAIICCFMSPEYQESENCQLELTYAARQHKHIIACLVADTKDWKPSDWLGLITSRLLYIRFKPNSEENICLKGQELVNRIKSHLTSSQPNCSQGMEENIVMVCEGEADKSVKHVQSHKSYLPARAHPHPHHAKRHAHPHGHHHPH
ncbi:hypothetical protein I4U23_023001 [Adineta vaga]|nr:hypothetical protein I4U23_023001 [Adineta vaga]